MKCELCDNPAEVGIPFCLSHQPSFWNASPTVLENKKVLVEVDKDGVIRIFRTVKSAVSSAAWDENRVARIDRGIAVGQIRRRVFERADYICERCGDRVTWESGHQHEENPRGKSGEISLDNCRCLCAKCHIGNSPYSAHGNRRLRFGERVADNISDT